MIPHSHTRKIPCWVILFLSFCAYPANGQSRRALREFLVGCGSIRVLAMHRRTWEQYGVDSYLPYTSPLNGTYNICSGYGPRFHPIKKRWMHHDGLDISCKLGTPVRSTADGIISYTGWRGGYGKCIIVRHPFKFTTLYGHLSYIYKRKGDRVCRGQVIGFSGNTGLSTGPHLHYETRKGGHAIPPIIL